VRLVEHRAHHDIEDNVLLVIHNLEALIDSRVNVDIPDSAAIHEVVLVLEVDGREDTWDRSRSHGSMLKLVSSDVGLVKSDIAARVGVDCGHGEALLNLWVISHELSHEFDSWRRVEEAWLLPKGLNDTDIRVELPDLLGSEALPSLGQELNHVHFVTGSENRGSSSVDGTSRHASDNIPSVVLRVAVVEQAPKDTDFPGSVVSSSAHGKSSALLGLLGGSERAQKRDRDSFGVHL